MIATGGRIAALAIGLPIVLGVVGFQAFSMVGLMAQTSEHHEATYAWHGGEIALDMSAGSLTVVTGDDNTVGVSYTEHYQLKKPTVTASAAATGLQLKARCRGIFFSNDCEINYVLTVPSSAKMTVHTGDGAVRISDLTGAVSLDTGNGDISLTNVSGDVQARTGNGGVRAVGLRSSEFQVNTGNGGVNLAWATAPKSVSVTSGNGGIHLTVPTGSGPYRVDVSSGNGGRDVSVPTVASAAASITVHTGNGGVSVGYPGG